MPWSYHLATCPSNHHRRPESSGSSAPKPAMKIVDVRWRRIRSRNRIQRDSEGRVHPGPERESAAALMTLVTDDGAEGYYFGASPEVIEGVIKPLLVGEDPFDREKIWQRLAERQRGNRTTLT